MYCGVRMVFIGKGLRRQEGDWWSLSILAARIWSGERDLDLE